MLQELKNKYVVGANMPGYMPDSEPWHCNAYAGALASFREDCERAIGDHIESLMCGPHELTDEEQAQIDAEDARLCAELKAVCKYPARRVERMLRIGDYQYWLEFAA